MKTRLRLCSDGGGNAVAILPDEDVVETTLDDIHPVFQRNEKHRVIIKKSWMRSSVVFQGAISRAVDQ